MKTGSKILDALYAHWQKRRGARKAPSRSDIDPVDIPYLLPHIYLVDIERGDHLSFRIRLMGTHLVQVFGKDYTRRLLREVDLDDHTQIILAEYKTVAETMAPICNKHKFVNHSGRPFDYDRLLLPLSSDGEMVSHLLGGMTFRLPIPSPELRQPR
jgi:hypothetical protein